MPSISERSLYLEKFGLNVSLAIDQKLTDKLSFNPRLKVTPASKITPEARAYISTNKAAIVASLMGEHADHDCMSCPYWRGELLSVDWKRRMKTAGGCGKGHRPWRRSNIASLLDYYCWHFVGRCPGPVRGSI